MQQLVVTAKQLATIKKSLIDGITISSGTRSSATYYHKREEQEAAIKQAVANMYAQSKELPLILANQKGATGKFIQEALLNEFKNTANGGACTIVNPIDWYDNGLSDKALLGALQNLDANAGIPYVLRLFMALKDNKINNERSRKIVLGYILGHPNLEYNSLKYKNKIRNVLKHIYGNKKTSIILSIAAKYVRNGGVYSDEKERNIATTLLEKYLVNTSVDKGYKILLFLFGAGVKQYYSAAEFPLISQYYTALTDINAVTQVPEEVLIGLVSSKKHPQYPQLWASKLLREATLASIRKQNTVTSANQQVRQTKKNESLGVVKEVKLEAVTDFLALYKTGYETGFTMDILAAIEKLAEKKKITNFGYQNIGIILDQSASMYGDVIESKNTPRAIAAFTVKVLSKSAKTEKTVFTTGENTDIATAFVEVLKKEDHANPYDAIFIITDGYENQYDGLTGEVIDTYLTETARQLPIYQISPITGAEMGANVRPIAKSNVALLAVNNPTSIGTQISAKLLEVDPRQWLVNQVRLLEDSTVSRIRKNHINA
ncbi:MAG: hypothetical protein HC836_32960 [Richelia sp. RM2_1_2]|nr:hypothetical protein [Richelia sp. RM2_1_2]